MKTCKGCGFEGLPDDHEGEFCDRSCWSAWTWKIRPAYYPRTLKVYLAVRCNEKESASIVLAKSAAKARYIVYSSVRESMGKHNARFQDVRVWSLGEVFDVATRGEEWLADRQYLSFDKYKTHPKVIKALDSLR